MQSRQIGDSNATTVRDVARASSLPASLYTSEQTYSEELENIFYSQFLLICHVDQIRNVGDIFVQQIGAKSILIVHSSDKTYSAFYNVCRHRGTQLLEKAGMHPLIQCGYHAWTYRLDGTLAGCPDMEETVGFDKKDYPLLPVRVKVWAGLVFVNLDPSTGSLESYLGDFPTRFSKYQMEKLRYVGNIGTYDIACNWKVYMENFNECYHCSVVHPETLGKYAKQHIPFSPKEIHGPYSMYYFDDREGAGATADLGSLAGARSDHSSTSESRAPTQVNDFTDDDLHRIYLPTIFPNTGMAVCPDYVVLYQCWPDGVSRSKVHLEFFSPESLSKVDRKETMSALDLINLQDKKIVEATQKGLSTGVFEGGRFSVWEKSVYHFQSLYVGVMNPVSSIDR
jgi:phenylpropionate dioxygenase-like ring-hydroxylating dioxygenase large terminal subunit